MVEDLLGRTEGVTTLVRTDDGSVWVYDELRHAPVPGTRRFRVDPSGDVDPPEFLRYRITG